MFSALREKLFGNKKDPGGSTSKSLAKSRLHFVLVQDRTGLTNDEMGDFKRELVSVIEKYFVIDKQGFDIDYKRENETTTLLINSPVIVRRQETISKDVGARKSKNQKFDKSEKKAKENSQDDAQDSEGETATSV